jgi:hypothetical protein
MNINALSFYSLLIQMTDCGTSMCPVCPTTSGPCVGVLGGADPSQRTGALPDHTNKLWEYGNSNYMASLRKTDTENTCGDNTGLGLLNASGYCIPGSIGENNSTRRNSALTVGAQLDSTDHDTDNNKMSLDNFALSMADVFPITSLHKKWGAGGGDPPFNRGVNSKNVYIGGGTEKVTYTLSGVNVSMDQKVLYMEAHGDKYSGMVGGIGQGNGGAPRKKPKMCYNKTSKKFESADSAGNCADGSVDMPQCPNWTELTSTDGVGWNKRVGGCGTTRENFGPGVYNMLCYVPKTDDVSNGGRGYVFAIWPFHYEEIYSLNKSDPSDIKSQYRVDKTYPCFNQCDPPETVKSGHATCPFNGTNNCKDYGDLFSVINHEIDIEIPANSPQLDWEKDLTWGTMNCNTWDSDIDNYDADSGVFYTQVAAKQKDNKTFISDQSESSTSKDYHWYTIDWSVDNDDFTKNYVKFYFDDPFDPTGKTTINGKPLPMKPGGDPVHGTKRFVPTRAGRLNFGPWFGWWGYNGQQKGSVPNFDTAKVRMAHMSIIPQSDGKGGTTGFDFPQSYDQPGVSCDFANLYSKSGGNVPPPPDTPPEPITRKIPKGLKWWVWFLIILSIVLVIAGIIGVVFFIKKKKSRK